MTKREDTAKGEAAVGRRKFLKGATLAGARFDYAVLDGAGLGVE